MAKLQPELYSFFRDLPQNGRVTAEYIIPNFRTVLQYVIHLFRYTQIYGDVSERGVPYLVSSVVAMLLVNGSVFALLERWHLSTLTGP